jgi:outer membrane protein assembly factor BamB
VANGLVYVPTQAGTAAAYAAETGALMWASPSPGFGGGDSIAREPTVANGSLYAGGSVGLYTFGLNG